MMINYGVHFLHGSQELNAEFDQSLESLLKVFDNSDCLLMYRDTGAQHCDCDGGEVGPYFTVR